jgi:hypothetical protein
VKRILFSVHLVFFFGCPTDIDVPEKWTELACATNVDCTGVIVRDVCQRAAGTSCSDIPLLVSRLPEYRTALREARQSCLFEPDGGDGVACREGFQCRDGQCIIGPLQIVVTDGE